MIVHNDNLLNLGQDGALKNLNYTKILNVHITSVNMI